GADQLDGQGDQAADQNRQHRGDECCRQQAPSTSLRLRLPGPSGAPPGYSRRDGKHLRLNTASACRGRRRGASAPRSAPRGRPARRRCTPTAPPTGSTGDRKSTRLNSSHVKISYAVFCLKKKNPSEAKGEG